MLISSFRDADDSRAELAALIAALGPVSDYPRLEYSRHDVRRAGEWLAGVIPWNTEEEQAEARRIFAIASSWRDSHVYPMRSVRMSLIQRMRRLGIKGITASRPKRMASIRRKLRVQASMKLDQINDVAGCRIITDDIDGVWSLAKECAENFGHPTRGKAYDYVRVAKDDGYRSYHMVFDFTPKDEHTEQFAGRRVELQVRSRLQHSWATAVEAVGTFRNENMKGGEGDPDWRRLFKLMSDEFAVAEGCEEGLTTTRSERITEIRDLDKRLRARGLLDDMRNVARYMVEYVQSSDAAYYLITYDHVTRRVIVTPYEDAMVGSLAYDNAERDIRWEEGAQKVVLVEVDKVSSLVDAYPNYFGDVLLFTHHLKELSAGGTVDYELRPQDLAPVKPFERPDMSWMSHPKCRG